MANDNTIAIKIVAQIDDLKAGLVEVYDSTDNAFTKMQESAAKLSAQMEQLSASHVKAAAESKQHADSTVNLGKAFDDVKNKIQTAFQATGILLLIDLIMKVANAVGTLADKAEEVTRLAEQFGLTTYEMQGMEVMAVKSHVQMGRLTTVIGQLTMKAAEAKTNGGALAYTFNDLGITMDKLNEPGMTAVKLLALIGDESNSNEKITALLGARFMKNIPIVRELAQAHGDLGAAAESIGAQTVQETAILTEYHEKMQLFGMQWEKVTAHIVTQAVPSMLSLADAIKKMAGAQRDSSGRTSVWEKLGNFLTGQLIVLFGQVVQDLQLIGDALNLVLNLIMNFCGAIVSLFSGSWTAVKDGFKKLWDGLVSDAKTGGDNLVNQAVANKDAFDEAMATPKTKQQQDVEKFDQDVKDKPAKKAKAAEEKKAKDEAISSAKGVQKLQAKFDDAEPNSAARVEAAKALEKEIERIEGADKPATIAAHKRVLDETRAYSAAIIKLKMDEAKSVEDIALSGNSVAMERNKADMATGRISAAEGRERERALIEDKLAIQNTYFKKVELLQVKDKAAEIKNNSDKVRAKDDATKSEMKLDTDATEEERKSKERALSDARAAALAEIAIDREKANEARLNQTISAADMLRIEIDLVARKLAAETAFFKGVAALRANDVDAQKKAAADIAKAANFAALETSKIQGKASRDTRKEWLDALTPISHGFTSLINGLIQGTMTWRKAFQQVLSSVISSFVEGCARMLVRHIAMELAKTSATKGHTLLRKILVFFGLMAEETAETAASTATVAAKAIESQALIAMSAGVAGAAGVASFAAAPWPIDMGAPAFGAAMALAAQSFAIAERGYDIPYGTNPIVQAHAREMILPAAYADVIRGMAAGGGGSGGGGGGDSGGGGAVHMHVHTQSTADFAKFFKSNSHIIAPALRQAVRNNGAAASGFARAIR